MDQTSPYAQLIHLITGSLASRRQFLPPPNWLSPTCSARCRRRFRLAFDRRSRRRNVHQSRNVGSIDPPPRTLERWHLRRRADTDRHFSLTPLAEPLAIERPQLGAGLRPHGRRRTVPCLDRMCLQHPDRQQGLRQSLRPAHLRLPSASITTRPKSSTPRWSVLNSRPRVRPRSSRRTTSRVSSRSSTSAAATARSSAARPRGPLLQANRPTAIIIFDLHDRPRSISLRRPRGQPTRPSRRRTFATLPLPAAEDPGEGTPAAAGDSHSSCAISSTTGTMNSTHDSPATVHRTMPAFATRLLVEKRDPARQRTFAGKFLDLVMLLIPGGKNARPTNSAPCSMKPAFDSPRSSRPIRK